MHPHPTDASALILILIVVTLCYIAACAYWPFTTCRRCDGSGRRRSPSGRAWRYCRRCDSTGIRLRTGRRIWNYLNNTRKANSR